MESLLTKFIKFNFHCKISSDPVFDVLWDFWFDVVTIHNFFIHVFLVDFSHIFEVSR